MREEIHHERSGLCFRPFLFSLSLAGCKEAVLAELPATVAPVSLPESSLRFDPLMATLVAFSPKTTLLASPDPVYYGSGCAPSEPTQLNVKFTETSELVTSLPGMSKGSRTSVAYRFHSPTTLPSAGGETKYIVSLLGLGSPHIFSSSLLTCRHRASTALMAGSTCGSKPSS